MPAIIDFEAQRVPARRADEQLVESGLVNWDAANSLGISSGLGLRGFSVSNQGSSQLQASRIFLNGHADIAWRFARDPVTIARAELLAGHDATLLGAGSPAGSLQYHSKQPLGEPFSIVEAMLADNGAQRITLDAERHWGPIQTRIALAVQRRDAQVERVHDERDAVLISNRMGLGSATIRLELEHHRNRMPFPFGTAYLGNRFVFDTPLVDRRASADRKYLRHALYLTHALGDGMQMTGHWQRATSHRDETLIGFFDVKNANQLRGYYRTIDESNGQHDAGLRVQGKAQTGAFAHQWAAVWQHFSLTREFAGPQNIGGFTLNADAPTFPADLSALALSPRFANERYRERGFALADAATWQALSLRAGLRRSSYQLDASTKPSLAPARAAQGEHTSASVSAGLQINPNQRLWLSRTESYLPNRGRLSSGAYLPPSEGQQWELGWQYKAGPQSLSLSLFDLRQSNLPGRDPADPDALRVIGVNRSKGLELQTKFSALGLGWQAALTRLQARVQDPVSTTQGTYLPGASEGYGSLSASRSISAQTAASASLQFSARRAGDDKNSFSAPGYAITNLRLTHRTHPNLHWGTAVHNLFDKRYVRALTGPDNVWQGQRRELRVWVSWEM